MAKKPSVNDFQDHAETYSAFLSMTKFSIVALIFVVIALYAFIVAEQPWVGVLFLLAAIPVSFIINRATSSRK